MSDAASEAPDAGKVAAETIDLRASPGKAVRFKRSAVVGIAAVGSVATIGVAWMSLSPPSFHMAAEASDKIEAGAPPDELANAPRTYGDLPKLGPPLPGDLGRPILAHQRAVMASEAGGGVDRSAEQAEAERQRLATDLKAARESGVMLQLASAGGRAGSAPDGAALAATLAAADDQKVALDPERDPNSQQRKADFLEKSGDASDVNPHRLTAAPSPYTLSAGSIIAASLISGLNSDLPGMVTAQITENAYDTATGRILLVPQGARLIGRYDSVVAFGQSRALVAWDRILMPDGSSIRIDNMPATDAGGYAGLSDQIDRHTWQLLKGVALSTLLGVGTELSLGDDNGDIVSALRRSAQLSGARAGDQLVGKSLNIQPTLKVRPGWPLRVVVRKDIVLQPWRGSGA